MSGKKTVIDIDGEFITLNEYIQAERGNKYAAAGIKKSSTAAALYACIGILPIEKYPVEIQFTWYRRNKRTDPDNISFAQKFVLDGIVEAGVLSDDGWNEVTAISHKFEVCDKPSVRIVIIERK